jgi:hypothetical protein
MQDAPVLFVIDDDPRTRSVVEGELCKRYGSDYRLISTESADDPLRLLARLSVDRRLVAIVLAVQWLFRMTGAQVLARVREFHPTAKRVLLADWGDLASYEPIQHAIALGQLDAYVAPPVSRVSGWRGLDRDSSRPRLPACRQPAPKSCLRAQVERPPNVGMVRTGHSLTCGPESLTAASIRG